MDSLMDGSVVQNAYQPSANLPVTNCDTYSIKHVEQISQFEQDQTRHDEQVTTETSVFQYQDATMLPNLVAEGAADEQLIDCSSSLNDDHSNQEGHHQLIQSNYETGQVEERIESASHNEQVLELQADENQDTQMNDDDAFVALCTDTSSVLNSDPTWRYYINKLYQPLNAQPDETPLAEQSDEYLLYQEMSFHASQELTDERQRVQLTKILEDDDGDDCDLIDDDNVIDDTNLQRDDTLERLHLTTIIEAFGSFPSSPLIDSCHGRDPLMIEACQAADECQDDDKPDSTRHHSEESPTSSVGNSNNLSSTTSFLQRTNLQQEHRIEHDDFDDSNQTDLHLGLGHKSSHDVEHIHDQDPHFSSITSDHHLAYQLHESQHQNEINDQHQQHHHHYQPLRHHQQPYSNQKNADNSSEIGYFQQVSSTFLPPLSSKPSLPANESSSNPMKQQHQNQTIVDEVKTSETRQSRKRLLQQVNEYDDRTLNEEFTRSKPIRVKKKRTNQDTDQNTVKTFRKSNTAGINRDESVSSPNGNVTSSITTPNDRISAIANNTDSNNIYKTKQHQREQVTKNEDSNCSGGGREGGEEFDDDEDGFSMNQDETASSSGRRNPHMSKYRRRTANARERIRMREINQAFERLKKVVPVELIQQSASGDESDQTSVSSRRGWGKSSSNGSGQQSSDSQSVKLTKITTLRLAVSYIAKLSEVLSQHPEPSEGVVNGDVASSLSQITTGTTEIGANNAGNRSKPSASTAKVVGQKADKSKSRAGSKKRPRPEIKSTKSSVPASTGKSLNETPNIEQNCSGKGVDTNKEAQVEGPTIVLDQSINPSSQQQTFLLTNNVLNGQLNHQASQNTSTFIRPIQQQQQLHKPHQQQIIYAQQPLSIPQSVSSQDRTFVTPVAVAILGIPTGANSNSRDLQQLQLLGIQNPHQIQQHQVLRQQHFQGTNGQHYNLITQQPQQVTLTLDDINGLSVLRLANNHRNNSATNSPTTIQLQPGRQPTFVQQPQILTTTSATNQSSTGTYNYSTYQPIQVSQVQSIGGQIGPIITTRPTGTFQFQNDTSVSLANGVQAMVATNRQLNSSTPIGRNDVVAVNSNSLQQSLTNTGNNSDCIDFGAASLANSAQTVQSQVSGNISDGRVTNNINSQPTLATANQIEIHQQSNHRSGQAIIQSNVGQHQLLALSQNGTQIQFRDQSAGCLRGQTMQPTNLIYINPPSANYTNENTINQNSNNNFHLIQPQQQTQRFVEQNQTSQNSGIQSSGGSRNRANGNSPAFEQLKFVTQFSSQSVCVGQSKNGQFPGNSEDNIRQLVASIATSIRPNMDDAELDSKNDSAKQQVVGDEAIADKKQHQQQQQYQQHHPKRTYRFHNYDGNMITNHLYSNHHDKQSQQQSSKRFGGQNQHHLEQTVSGTAVAAAAASSTNTTPTPNTCQTISTNATGPRSRQNSLSSTCSTISSASSSLNSSSLSSNVSPSLGFSPAMMLKSAALDNGSNSSSDSTPARAVPIVIVEEVEEAGGSC